MQNNDLISRAVAISCLGNHPEEVCMPWSEVERILRELPAVDATPVVCCEQCVHYNTAGVEGQGLGMCHCLGITARDGFYCRFGQEKDGGKCDAR